MIIELPQSSPTRLLLEARFSTDPQTLFTWLTQPEKLVLWWPQEADVEAQQDGAITLKWPAMQWTLTGRWLVFTPELLKMTWNWTHEPDLPERTVSFALSDCDCDCAFGARLTLTHGEYGTSQTERDDRQSHVDGWHHFLARLEQCIKAANP